MSSKKKIPIAEIEKKDRERGDKRRKTMDKNHESLKKGEAVRVKFTAHKGTKEEEKVNFIAHVKK